MTLVNSNEYFQFVSSNPWVAVGWRKRSDITFPIEPYLSNKNIDFIHATCTEIEALANQMHLDNGSKIDYDYLVITTDPKLVSEEVEGSGPEGGYTKNRLHD